LLGADTDDGGEVPPMVVGRYGNVEMEDGGYDGG
jgi:hypothetical protein